ncbi:MULTISPECIES: hypothetical protein [unclassified Yoonia]|uniref:hypothetical protein n=1 Tax=unclassified Yoonia TaxID=2629118 RepID=UPI002AFF9555|nr:MULTISPECIES: hypothetical protein [unclassified Yoonia]
MVAYSYKKVFAPLIAVGLKTQTIRAARRRHARPGEMIQHYTGLRTKAAQKICSDTLCLRVDPVILRFSPALGGALVLLTSVEVAGVAVEDVNHFAKLDGFEGRREMSAFWVKNHGAMELFEGVLIAWEPPQGPIAIVA